jgi:hypothetical protein
MARIAAAHSIGVLVIDEIQNLASARSGGEQVMLNFFSELVNTIGVPVVLVGTPKAVDVLTRQFRHARRSTGQGDMFWDRMSVAAPEHEAEWSFFCERLWRYQFTKQATPLTPELRKALYEESQGITDVVVKLYMLAQLRAIQTGTDKITAGHIRTVARDSLRCIKPVLDALRRNDRAYLAKADDVLSRGLQEIVLGLGPVQAPILPAAPTPAAVPVEGPITPPKAPPKPPSRRRRNVPAAPQTLEAIVTAGRAAGTSAYDALKAAGIVADDALAA